MKFVTGGCCQGKKQWVMCNWQIQPDEIADGAVCTMEKIQKAKAVDHFHLLVQRWLRDGCRPSDKMADLLKANPDMIIITDEIGCGIVPLEKKDREWREIHGRLCCQLAGRADTVIRVIAGIGQKLK